MIGEVTMWQRQGCRVAVADRGNARGWWWGGEDEVLALNEATRIKGAPRVTSNGMKVEVKVKDVGRN